MNQKTAYICGPLTELPSLTTNRVKRFYERIADVYGEVMGTRAFVPHEHCDPARNADLSPCEVDTIERRQVCELTTVLVVVALQPSWGGGIEVEMANQAGVPVIIIQEQNKRVSRLLKGNPAVRRIFFFETEEQVLELLRDQFESMKNSGALVA